MKDKILFSTKMDSSARERQQYLSGIFSKYVDLSEADLLEIGCGNGRFGVVLGEVVKSYSGIDPDGERIKLACEVSPEADYRVGVAEDIPFKQKFDIIFYPNSWHFIRDYEKASSEAQRVLKKDGIIAILEPLERDFGWASPALNRGTPQFDEQALEQKFSQLRKGREVILENGFFEVVQEETGHSRLYILKAK